MSDKFEKVAIAIIKNAQGKVLIIQRTKPEVGSDQTKLTWAFPGGRVEDSESSEEAAVREVSDETGYTVSILEKLSERDHPQFPAHIIYFACELVVGAKMKAAFEVHEIEKSKWVEPTDLKDFFTTDLDPKVAKYLGL